MIKNIMKLAPVSKLLILGAITGSLVGLIGSIFQIMIIYISQYKNSILLSDHSLVVKYIFAISFSTVLLIVSLLLVRGIAPETSGSGVQEIEGILEGKRQMKWYKVLPIKFFAGLLSLSSGLVLGREGPTIQMGGAIGQMLKDLFNLDSEHKHILIAAGAGAGLAAAFNAPLAGILFVVEEMRGQFHYSFKSLQTVIIACVCSDIVLQILMGNSLEISMVHLSTPPIKYLWVFILLGILFGLTGFLFNKLLVKFLNFFMLLTKKQFWVTITGIGVITGVLSILYPNTIGGGYTVMPAILQNNMTLSALVILFILRMLTTWTSYGTGAPGGIFAPMLALGTILGFIYGSLLNLIFPSMLEHLALFAVCGMSALFSATVGAPLTGIVLVIEMTGNYSLILPLIITCLSATTFAHIIGGKPIYSTLLNRTLAITHKPSLYINLLNKKR
jgi:chloride channel protein, CIC family